MNDKPSFLAKALLLGPWALFVPFVFLIVTLSARYYADFVRRHMMRGVEGWPLITKLVVYDIPKMHLVVYL